MSSILSHFRAAIEYFNWPLGDMTTKGHIRSLNEAAAEIERLQSLLEAANEMEADREAALQEIERLKSDVKAAFNESWKRGCEIERLQKRHAEAQHKIGEYVDLTARLRAALEEIASQGRPVEFDDEEKAIADYEAAYDLCVLTAREALRDE